jgi:DNA-binding response OmpR family regulator
MNILVIEDEPKISKFLKKGLETEGYLVDAAMDGEEGLRLAQTNDYDAVVLDLMLPKLDGLSVCRELRASEVLTPILMLTARDGVSDRVTGLDVGADDYLTKPFAFEEFLARLRALVRRGGSSTPPVLQISDLTLNPATHTVERSGNALDLSPTEFRLLHYLMMNAGRALPRTLIEEHVWGSQFDRFTNAVDVYISKLRSKIDKDRDIQLIRTVRNIGYTIKE